MRCSWCSRLGTEVLQSSARTGHIPDELEADIDPLQGHFNGGGREPHWLWLRWGASSRDPVQVWSLGISTGALARIGAKQPGGVDRGMPWHWGTPKQQDVEIVSRVVRKHSDAARFVWTKIGRCAILLRSVGSTADRVYLARCLGRHRCGQGEGQCNGPEDMGFLDCCDPTMTRNRLFGGASLRDLVMCPRCCCAWHGSPSTTSDPHSGTSLGPPLCEDQGSCPRVTRCLDLPWWCLWRSGLLTALRSWSIRQSHFGHFGTLTRHRYGSFRLFWQS